MRRPDGSNFIARVHLAPLAGDADATLLATLEDLTEFEHEIARERQGTRVVHVGRPATICAGPLRILKGFADALEDECGAMLNEEGRNFLKEILQGQRSHGRPHRRIADAVARRRARR